MRYDDDSEEEQEGGCAVSWSEVVSDWDLPPVVAPTVGGKTLNGRSSWSFRGDETLSVTFE